MDPSEINNFENQWKKAFDEASETPPPSVWGEIEARLDRDENNIIPLWWRSPKLWYAAASIIALLVVGGGYLMNKSTDIPVSEIAERSPQAPENRIDKLNNSSEDSTSLVLDEAKEDNVIKQQHSTEKVPAQRERLLAGAQQKKSVRKPFDAIPTESRAFIARADLVKNDHVIDKNSEGEPLTASESEVLDKYVVGIANNKEASVLAEAPHTGLKIDALEGVGVSELDVFIQKRYVFYKPEALQEEKLPELKKKGEYWAGIGLMPATFNPDVQIRQAAPSFYSAQNFNTVQSSGQKSATGTSKAGNSYAVQTQGGMKLSKHWSIETGISYLKGNSSYEGGGYVLNAITARSANMLEDALVNLSTAKSAAPNSPNQQPLGGGASFDALGNTFIDVNRNVSNNYQYLQLPVQAGFTLRPEKKLSYSVLGGMMANFFLSNELESATGQIIKTTANDEVYRSMNWAATTGLRFNYKLSDRWRASLMGSYQRAVSSGFRANQSLESHPYLYGVSWGMRYSF